MTNTFAFRAIDVGDGTDERWAARVRDAWPTEAAWLTPEGRTEAGAADARRLFERYMPELVPVLDRLAAAFPDRRAGETLLTHAALRPFFGGCTQTAVGPVLLRNYDFDPRACGRTVLASHFLRPVIGTADSVWGLLDGMNDAGLAVSLTFGGRFVSGPGFSVIMVLRYLLETCETTAQALAALDRLPVALAQNVTVVDRDGHAATVYTGPDIPATRAPDACAANHQHLPVPPEQDADTHTLARLAAVRAAAGDARPDAVLAALLRPPLHQTRYDAGLGTVYTAVYRPAEGRLTYHWPGQDPWEHTLAAFRPGTREVALPPAAVTA